MTLESSSLPFVEVNFINQYGPDIQKKVRGLKTKSYLVVPSLKLTAKAPKTGWLEYFLVSFWGKRPIFRC